MFEDAANYNGLTQRLRQDMNPGSLRSIPEPPQAPPAAAPVSSPVVPEPAPIAVSEELPIPEVETAPFVLKVKDTKLVYLVWLSLVMVLPSCFFWLVSLLYTFGARTILVSIVTAIPFPVIVGMNVFMPLLSAILSGIMLVKTEPDSLGKLIAKISLSLSSLCLASLAFWLAFEAF